MFKPIAAIAIALLSPFFIAQTPTLANPIQIAQNRDVFPGDWAYEALQNLSQNYNCITGYPDDTFQGDRVLTRYEFAAGLVSCIQSMESKILENGDFATQEDWQEMQQFLQEASTKLDLQETQVELQEIQLETIEQ
ncbi:MULTISPECIES: S-layer homology domain-containing protein [Spirulina sp. CCY15215]|uniref:S-layer homology domain-containing protein n=1 Tax=Spirulina sp. CCY15215 TaxID=2767591 RepID=UPI00194EDC89|nr:S-layer homology domain-containing protein [Spirulina major]